MKKEGVEANSSPTSPIPGASHEQAELTKRATQLAARRLLPILGICYFFAYLDRTAVSISALTMNEAVGLSAAVFGLGAGLFFIGYLLFEVPSNLIMHKVGARVWMGRIMVTWGAATVAQGFIWNEQSFYAVRLLLGVAEAGFFPGMILYLTYWFPASQRARVMGWFLCAIPLSTALGAPIGGLLLKIQAFGLDGWQWMFLLLGTTTIVLGVYLFCWLTDRPEKASWLPEPEKKALIATLAAENRTIESEHSMSALKSMTHPRVMALSAVYFALLFGIYGIGFWLPTIIKRSLGMTNHLDITLLTAAPYAVGALAIVLAGKHVDKRNQPAKTTAIFMGAGGVALAATALISTLPWLGYAGLFVCAVAVMATLPGFWRLPTSFLTGAAAAAGIAIINSVGGAAGFVGTYWIGWVTENLGDARWGLVSIGIAMTLGAALVLKLGSNALTTETATNTAATNSTY
jgi:MFS family permease